MEGLQRLLQGGRGMGMGGAAGGQTVVADK